jgi:hypothetical protein
LSSVVVDANAMAMVDVAVSRQNEASFPPKIDVHVMNRHSERSWAGLV